MAPFRRDTVSVTDELRKWADRVRGNAGIPYVTVEDGALRDQFREVFTQAADGPPVADVLIETAPGWVRVTLGGSQIISEWDGTPDDLLETVHSAAWTMGENEAGH